MPPYQPDNERRTIVSRNIPGAVALVHDSAAAASVSLANCFALLLHAVVNAENAGDGRRCQGCNVNYVGYTAHTAFTDLPEGLLLQLSRGTTALGVAGNKNFRHVALPEVLDMTPYIQLPAGAHGAHAALPPSRRRCTRGLTTKTGHYYTYRCAMPGALGAGGGAGFAPAAWERWDAAVVTEVTWATVAAAPAFLVVYEVIDAALLRTVFPRAAVILPVPQPEAA